MNEQNKDTEEYLRIIAELLEEWEASLCPEK